MHTAFHILQKYSYNLIVSRRIHKQDNHQLWHSVSCVLTHRFMNENRTQSLASTSYNYTSNTNRLN